MAREIVNFGVELDRKIDSGFKELAKLEGHESKRRYHAIIIERLVELWEKRPNDLRKIGLIRDAGAFEMAVAATRS